MELAQVITLVSQSMRPLLEGKQQKLQTHVDAGLPAVLADRDRVVQVLTNLVSNAHKYTQAGGEIDVRACARDGMVAVEVQDNGMGIPPEDVPKLFTRFFRVDSSLTREIGGTGLGLSIVRSIVEMQGGTVSVDSTPGQGSTFAFTLPLAQPDSVRETVLLVNGESAVAAELQHAGYRVQSAESAAFAVQQMVEGHRTWSCCGCNWRHQVAWRKRGVSRRRRRIAAFRWWSSHTGQFKRVRRDR